MLQLSDVPPSDPAEIPAPPPAPKPAAIKLIELRDAILFGAVAGFATSIGTFVFDLISGRKRR